MASDHDALPRFAVGARRQLNRSDSLARPFESAVVGDYLVVLERSAGPAIHVIDRLNGNLLRSFGRRGEGPGEFEMAWSVDADPAGASIWIFDPSFARLTRVDLKELLISPDSFRPQVVSLETVSLGGPVWTARGVLMSPGLFEDHRFAVIDSTGHELSLVGAAPVGDPNLSAEFRGRIHRGTPVTNPARDRIVIGSLHVPRIEVFDLEGTSVTVAETPFEWDLTVEDFPYGVFAMRPDWRTGYTAVAASRQWFFGLFNGRTLEEYQDRIYFGGFVHVFDWNGRFVGYIPLDTEATDISVDPQGTTLYVLEWDPVPTVSTYQILQPDPGDPR